MGDQAEAIFEETYGNNFVRWGLNRPPLQMHKLSTTVRYSPDYLTSDGFVEVKGCGRDGQIKLKLENWNALEFWSAVMPVRLFVWDSHKKRHCIVGLGELARVINDPSGNVKSDHFHDGKLFLKVPVASLEGWVDHG